MPYVVLRPNSNSWKPKSIKNTGSVCWGSLENISTPAKVLDYRSEEYETFMNNKLDWEQLTGEQRKRFFLRYKLAANNLIRFNSSHLNSILWCGHCSLLNNQQACEKHSTPKHLQRKVDSDRIILLFDGGYLVLKPKRYIAWAPTYSPRTERCITIWTGCTFSQGFCEHTSMGSCVFQE
jgi:hypothetical protein